MSNIITLTKTLLKNSLLTGISSKKGKGKGIYAYIIVLAIYVLAFSVPIIMLLKNILVNYHFEELILSFVVPIGGVAALLFSVFSVTSIFYYNKDIEQMLPYPVKSGELFIAKFLVSLSSVYLVLFMFIYPIIFGVGIGSGAGALYFAYAAGICLLMPIIPASIIAFILMLLSRVVNLGKRKTLFMYITVALVMAFSLGYGIGIGYLLEMDIADIVNILSGEATSVIKISRNLFPLFNSASYALIHSQEMIGAASFGTFVGLNLLSVIILYFLGEALYIKGLTKDAGAKKEKQSIEKIYKKEKGGVMLTLLKKEWRIIRRTPVFMLNIVVINLIFPILFIITYLIAPEGKELLDIDFNNPGVYLIVCAITIFMCEVPGATGSSSAISREGKAAKYMKLIPVNIKTQIDAKVCFSFILDIICAVITELCLVFVFDIPWVYLLLINIPLVFIILTFNYVHVLWDLRNPKVNWSDESESVKQNMTVLIGMLLSFVLAGIIAAVGVLLFNSNLSIYLVFLIFTLISIMCYILMAIYIKKKDIKLFDKVM
jgi:ABC-2 type transport system permease protein